MPFADTVVPLLPMMLAPPIALPAALDHSTPNDITQGAPPASVPIKLPWTTFRSPCPTDGAPTPPTD